MNAANYLKKTTHFVIEIVIFSKHTFSGKTLGINTKSVVHWHLGASCFILFSLLGSFSNIRYDYVSYCMISVSIK